MMMSRTATAPTPILLLCFLVGTIAMFLASPVAAFALLSSSVVPPTSPRFETRLGVGNVYNSDAMMQIHIFREKKSHNRNLYEILHASPTDSPAALKRKYLFLAKQSHPDMATNSAIDFSEVSAAYAILSDPQQRRSYDRKLAVDLWIEAFCEALGGMAEFLVFFWQAIALPLWQKTVKDSNTAVSNHEAETRAPTILSAVERTQMTSHTSAASYGTIPVHPLPFPQHFTQS